MKISAFTDLEIWKLSVEVTVAIYKITRNNEFKKDFGLVDQIRRAIISVSSNIAEGFERNNNNEFIQYLRIAKGSAGEVRSQLLVSLKLGYITQQEYVELEKNLITLSSKIGNFLTYLNEKKKIKEFTTR